MNHTAIAIIFIVLAPIIGGLIYGIERIIRARMQQRIGPPLLQPFYDFFKLLQKRTLIVHSTHAFLGIMHFVSLWFALAVLVLGGDFILVIYLHLLSTALLILGGFSTRSVFSHLGSNRLAISAMAYEPVLILIAVSTYMITGSFNISAIYSLNEPLLYKMPLAFVALLLILPIKLKKSPFDIAEAHQEITGGSEIEYSGIFYEFIYAAKWIDYIFAYFLVYLFVASNIYLAITVLILTFIYINALDNSTARVNYQQMLKFIFWTAFPAAFLNLILVSVI
jgi:ech hydrogenase subunit B